MRSLYGCMITHTIEDRLRAYLISRKVAPIWADGALRSLPLSTNHYFTKGVEVKGLVLHPAGPSSKGGRQIKELVIVADLIFPDAKKDQRRAIITYHFLRGRKAPHRVEIQHNVTKA